VRSVSLWGRDGRRDPFADIDEVFGAIVNRAFGSPVRVTGRPAGFLPAADVERDGDDAVVRLELPGLDPERDVTVEVIGGRLIVKGERRSERSDDRDGRVLREVRYGSFERSFGLPEHVGASSVTASYDAGVLTVRVSGVNAPAPVESSTKIAIASGSDPAEATPAEATEQETATS
jgi:HSP20 family molecular chaperone IbpA